MVSSVFSMKARVKVQCRYMGYARAIECVQLPDPTYEDVSWFELYLHSRNIDAFWRGWLWILAVDNVDATCTYKASPGDCVLIHGYYILGVYTNYEFNSLMQDTFKEVQ